MEQNSTSSSCLLRLEYGPPLRGVPATLLLSFLILIVYFQSLLDLEVLRRRHPSAVPACCWWSCGHPITISATAGGGAELIGLRELTDSDFPSRATLDMNSFNSMVEGHHMHVHVLLVLSLHLRHFLALVFHLLCCLLLVHMSTSCNLDGCSQGPTGRRPAKGGVSDPAQDLRPVSDLETEVNFRPADQAREQVVVHSSGRRPGPGTRLARGCAVTPSIHLKVPDSQFVPPGRGLGLRQSMGWRRCAAPRGLGSGCQRVTPEIVCHLPILTA